MLKHSVDRFLGAEDSPDFSSLRIIKKFNTFQGWDIQWCKEARDAAHRIAAMEEPHFDHATWIQLSQRGWFPVIFGKEQIHG